MEGEQVQHQIPALRWLSEETLRTVSHSLIYSLVCERGRWPSPRVHKGRPRPLAVYS